MPFDVYNFPFAARLEQSKDAKQLDVGFTSLVNVAFDYDGALTKRPGLTLAWNGGSTSYDNPERLIQVGKTLAMIGGAAPTSVANDSQMGNVSLYSNKLDSWAGSGDWLQWVSPCYVEREDMAAHLDSSLVDGDVAFCNGYIVQAWIRDGLVNDEWEVVVRVIDAETGTVRDERTYDTSSGDSTISIKALKCTKGATVNIVMVTWILVDSSTDPDVPDDLRRALINLTSTSPSFGAAADLVQDVADYYDAAPGPVAANDQQWIVGVEVAGGSVDFSGYNSAATNVHTYATTEDRIRPSVTTIGGTDVSIAWFDSTTRDLEVRRYSQSALVANTPIVLAEGPAVNNLHSTALVHIPDMGANDCLVAWSYAPNANPVSEIMGWARTDHDGVGPIGALSRVRRLRPYSHMFVQDQRVYMCVADGDDIGAGTTHSSQRRLHWVNLPIAINDDSPAFRPIPVASSQLGLPTTVYSNPGVLRSVSRDNSVNVAGRLYQSVVTEHPVVGEVNQDLIQAQQMVKLQFPGSNVAERDYGRAVQLGGQTYVAGGYVSQFDDVRFFENGFLQAPGFSVSPTAGGTLGNLTIDVKVVYEFLDDSDQIAFSLESESKSVTTTDGANETITVLLEPLTLTLKQQKFYNARKVLIGIYGRTGNNPFQRFTAFDTLPIINDPESLTAITATYTGTPAILAASNPALYTNGGRLETDVLSGATALAAYKGRLWAAGGEFGGNIYYSLEWTEGEPICFSLDQFLTIPETRITALVALDELLYAFSEDGIWCISGEGPNPQGADGSFRIERLTSDTGMQWPRCWCVGRDGIYFIGRKGFCLLTRARTVQYLGAPTQTDFAAVFDWRAAVVVDSRAEIRFYCQASFGVSSCIVHNYEGGEWARWVYIPPSDGVSVDAVLWNGAPTLLTTGAASVIGKVYQDGAEYRDDTTFYAMSATTGEVRFGKPHELKRFQRLHLLLDRSIGHSGVQCNITVAGQALGTHTSTWTQVQLDVDAVKDRVRVHVRDQKFLAWTINLTEVEASQPVDTSAMRWSGLAFQVRPIGGVGRASDTASR